MRKRQTKQQWYDDALDADGKAKAPELASDPEPDRHVDGLIRGEFYICDSFQDPTIFIRTNKDTIVPFRPTQEIKFEELNQYYVRKDINDIVFGELTFKKLQQFMQGIVLGSFQSGALGTGGAIKIDEKTGESYAEFDRLLVRKVAHFLEVMVDRLDFVGGQRVVSPASGFKVSRVEETEDGYKLYFPATDGDTTVRNEFKVGDQARSQTFNLKDYNRYWWRLVTAVGDDWIEVSKSDCDTDSDIPVVDDKVAMLGNRNDKTRQNAQIISAYGIDAPSWKMYECIDSYSLEGKCRTWFSSDGNQITGRLVLQSGETVEDAILDKVGYQVYVYTTSGNLTLNGDIDETLYAEVWRGKENVTDTIMSSLYSWQRISADPTGDAVWNKLHEGVGSSIAINGSDVVRKAMFVCNVVVGNQLLTSLQE